MGDSIQNGTDHRNYFGRSPVTRHLRPVVLLGMDPGQELADLNTGPMFSDEYTNMIRDLNLNDESLDRLMVLEGLQDELADDYLDAWCRMVAKLSEAIGIEIHICDPSNLHPSSARNRDPRVSRIRTSISELISVNGSGDTWSVKVTGNPIYTAPDTAHAESGPS